MPLSDLVNETGNDEAILSLWLVSVSTDNCGHIFTTKSGMVSLDGNMAGVSSASSSHNAIHGTAAKVQLTARSLNTFAWRSDSVERGLRGEIFQKHKQTVVLGKAYNIHQLENESELSPKVSI